MYVVFFYTIYQILTRSDENEILSHLGPLSNVRMHHGGTSDSHHVNYHLPHLPHRDSTDPSPRYILAILMYPVYLLITILAIPIPLLLNALNLVMSVVGGMLGVVWSPMRMFGRTFVLGPAGVAKSLLDTVWPLVVWGGGVVSVGCAMGLGAGVMGRLGVEWIGPKRPKSSRSSGKAKSKDRAKSSTATSRSRSLRSAPTIDVDVDVADDPARSSRGSRESRGREGRPARHDRVASEVPALQHPKPILQRPILEDGEWPRAKSTGRPGVVVGVRRRGVRET